MLNRKNVTEKHNTLKNRNLLYLMEFLQYVCLSD